MGKGKTAGSNAPGAFLVHYYPAVRTGSSNTHFFSVVFFFGGHLPQTSGFRSAKQILVVSFATQARAFILSDRSIFYTPGGLEQRRGLMPLGLFLFSSFFVVTCPRLLAFARPDKYLPCLSLHGLGLVS